MACVLVVSLSPSQRGATTGANVVAVWMYGPNWPNNGEVDIIEGANTAHKNLMSAHTYVIRIMWHSHFGDAGSPQSLQVGRLHVTRQRLYRLSKHHGLHQPWCKYSREFSSLVVGGRLTRIHRVMATSDAAMLPRPRTHSPTVTALTRLEAVSMPLNGLMRLSRSGTFLEPQFPLISLPGNPTLPPGASQRPSLVARAATSTTSSRT